MADNEPASEPLTLEGPLHTTELVETPAMSLAVALQRGEIDQQVSTAKAYPRSIKTVTDRMITLATYNEYMAEECIYSLPRGGKQIRGESIRFAEIVREAWGNCRDGARVTHVDRLERYVEAEGIFFDLETNMATTTRVRRTIELKKNKTTIDQDMVQLAGAAAMSIARRNAVLGGVSKIFWKPASDAVHAVIRGDQKTLAERRDRAIAYFQKAGVPLDRLLAALEIPAIDDVNLDHLVTMQGWRTALGSGEASLDEIFPERKPTDAAPQGLKEKMSELGRPRRSRQKQITPDAEAESAETRMSASREASDEGAGRDGGSLQAQPAPEQAAGVGAPAAAPPPEAPQEAQDAPAARHRPQAPAKEEKAASGGGRVTTAHFAALQAKGEALALQGEAALDGWLRGLSPDEQAAIGPMLEASWRKIARFQETR